ncbi:hypothetical protein [Massilia sp. TWR1-2-2]|uniref:hypothetical protein n=1 Tax=Massilia sp. TWR1-2-2 TaxID=2804584 RepID=UPI003CFB64D6
MNSTDDSSAPNACLDAARRLETALGALAEAMGEVERVAAMTGHSTYMAQVVAERARWHQLESITQPVETLAATLASPESTQRMLQLLAPSIVFPAATPIQIDISGEALSRARRTAEMHKENLRKLIATELRRIAARGDAG